MDRVQSHQSRVKFERSIHSKKEDTQNTAFATNSSNMIIIKNKNQSPIRDIINTNATEDEIKITHPDKQVGKILQIVDNKQILSHFSQTKDKNLKKSLTLF